MNVLVMMSTYNGEKYLEEQINSILAQKGVFVYLLVRDDGSTDSTTNILKRYVSEYPNNITVICGENIGFGASFHNLTINALKLKQTMQFQYYAFSDQDDIWKNEKLIVACNALNELNDETTPILYCSSRILVNNELLNIGKTISPPEILQQDVFWVNAAAGCTCVFNDNLLNEFSRTFDKSMVYHDYWLFIIAKYIGRVYYDENSYILYRQHGSNFTGNQIQTLLDKFKKIHKSLYKSPLNVESTLAKKFIEFYASCVDDRTREIITTIANYQISFYCKAKLLLDLSGCFKLNNLLDFLILKLRIVFNRL